MARTNGQAESTGSNLDTPRAAAGIVIGSLVALWVIRRGFRGVSVSVK